MGKKQKVPRGGMEVYGMKKILVVLMVLCIQTSN